MFAPPSVQVEERPGGAVLIRSRRPLLRYARSVGAVLDRWARERGEQVFLGERDGAGWRTMTYAELFGVVRRVASGLLEMGLSAETPVAILSPAALSHAIVSLAAQ